MKGLELLHTKLDTTFGKELATAIIKKVNSLDRSLEDDTTYALRVKSMAELLLTIKKRHKEVKKAIKEALNDWKDAEILKSLPGAGNILTAQLLGEIGFIDRFESSYALAPYCGVAPIPHSSSKWQTDKNTKRVNRVAKDALMQLAQCSRRYNSISTQYYQKKRDEGKSHWHALKCLARNLVRVIYAMLRDRTYYQPHHGGEKEEDKTTQPREKQPATATA